MYDPRKDELNTADINDTRKPRITLKKLNELKRLKAVREIEQAKDAEVLNLIYGQTENEDQI